VSERQRRIVLVTGVHDRIEDGHPLLEGDVKVVESGFLFPLDFGVVAEHLDEDRLPFEFGLLFGVFVDHPVVFVVESPLLGRLRAFHLQVFRCFLALGFGLLRAHIRSSLCCECGVDSLRDERDAGDDQHRQHDLLLGPLEALVDQRVVDAVGSWNAAVIRNSTIVRK